MMHEEMTQAVSPWTPIIINRPSRLDDLKYALASAGYSAERIDDVEQRVLHQAYAFGRSPEQVADELLLAFSAGQAFQDAMSQLVNYAGAALQELSNAIQRLAEDVPVPQPVKPTEKTPYYHKKKHQWWK